MTDVELFGPNPRAMHAVNVLLHMATACLVFVGLRAITGAEGRSFTVAALFAAHPLRVESVAWIAERKDVLSACFIAATLVLYERYVRHAFARSLFSRSGSIRRGLYGEADRDYRACYLAVAGFLASEAAGIRRESCLCSPLPSSRLALPI